MEHTATPWSHAWRLSDGYRKELLLLNASAKRIQEQRVAGLPGAGLGLLPAALLNIPGFCSEAVRKKKVPLPVRGHLFPKTASSFSVKITSMNMAQKGVA